ncbi:MAG: hypothetical protein K6G18_16830 [Treponema sp.]|nr:hypothetical protein [Treponema sp.]
MNHIISGDYAGGFISVEYDKFVITPAKGDRVLVNAKTVKAYELVTEDSQKSMASGIARGLVGGALLGGVGLVAGATTAKSKGTYRVAIEFMDGKKSLFELDDKAYKDLTRILFNCGQASPEEVAQEIEEFNKSGKKKMKGAGCALVAFGIAITLLVLVIVLVKKA